MGTPLWIECWIVFHPFIYLSCSITNGTMGSCPQKCLIFSFHAYFSIPMKISNLPKFLSGANSNPWARTPISSSENWAPARLNNPAFNFSSPFLLCFRSFSLFPWVLRWGQDPVGLFPFPSLPPLLILFW